MSAQSLISMGFSNERVEEALIETNNGGIDVALEWLLITDGIDTNKTDKEKEKCPVVESKSGDSSSAKKVDKITQQDKCETQASIGNRTTGIRVRLLNGKMLTKTFNANDKLNDVMLWIQSHIPTEQFGLMVNDIPKKIFTDDDYQQSLEELNLVPRAVVIVTQTDKWNGMKQSSGATFVDENRKIEDKRRKEEIEKRFKEMEEERLALERVRTQIEDDKAARRERWPNLYEHSPENRVLPIQQTRALLPRNDGNKKTE